MFFKMPGGHLVKLSVSILVVLKQGIIGTIMLNNLKLEIIFKKETLF